MLLIDAKDDRLLKAITALLQERRDLPRYQCRPLGDDQRTVEVLDVVDAILNLLAVAVELALLRTVALDLAVDMDP